MKKLSIKKDLKQHKRSIPDDLLYRAKQMYMDFESVTEIARVLDIKRTSLQYYVKQYWKQERSLASSEIISTFASARAKELASIQDSSLKVVDRCLRNLANRAEPPSTKEGVDAMKILTEMDKLAKENPDKYSGYQDESNEDTIDLEVVDPFSVVSDNEEEEIEDDAS